MLNFFKVPLNIAMKIWQKMKKNFREPILPMALTNYPKPKFCAPDPSQK